jgi:ElaB/YqjD/DUF883 family membrane-anchored ribosome-binding protein
MSTQPLTTPFPASQQDVARLKQTAIDAVNDLGSTATVHATKAKGQIKELAGHVQEEGTEHLNQVKGKLSDVLDLSREFVSNKPLACLAAALTVGFIIGISRSGSRA